MTHSSALLECQEWIDQEIEVLTSRLQVLCTTRNALAPINQLPVEIFTEIFLCLQEKLVKSFRRDSRITWIRVTHVSKFWRTLVFSSKVLWTQIPTDHIAYAQHAYQLSYPIPISLTKDFDMHLGAHEIDDKELQALLPSLQRAWKLKASSSAGTFFASALQSDPDQAPFLRDVELSYVDVPAGKSPFPECLTRLRLSSCSFECSWLKFDHLTELCIYHIEEGVEVDTLLDCLVQIPNLSDLSICWLFVPPGLSGGPPRQYRRTTPFTLQHLKINDNLSSVADFISCIRLSADFTLNTEFYPTEDSVEAIKNFFHQLNHHLAASKRIIRNCHLMHTDAFNVTFSSFHQGESEPFLTIQTLDFPEELWDTISHGLQSLPFGQLYGLSTDKFITGTVWLKSPTNLRKLDLYGHDASHAFLEFLAAETDLAKQSNDWDNLSFTTIKSITLRDVEFDRTLKKNAVAAFTRRAVHGYGIKKLTFVDGTVTEHGIKQLRKVIDRVIVV